jgi:hypothetical protein
MDKSGGGATQFKDLPVKVTPKRGTALLFFPAFADGQPDSRTVHAGGIITSSSHLLETRHRMCSVLSPFPKWSRCSHQLLHARTTSHVQHHGYLASILSRPSPVFVCKCTVRTTDPFLICREGSPCFDVKWIAQMWVHQSAYKPAVPPGNSHDAIWKLG